MEEQKIIPSQPILPVARKPHTYETGITVKYRPIPLLTVHFSRFLIGNFIIVKKDLIDI